MPRLIAPLVPLATTIAHSAMEDVHGGMSADTRDYTDAYSGYGEAPSAQINRFNSADLLGVQREIEIDHGGRIYRLRVTQSNKLILIA